MITRLETCPSCGTVFAPGPSDVVPAPPPAAAPPPPPPPPPPPLTYDLPAYPAPAPRPAQPGGLSAASVPKILLGLGATCLLVAAVIFLAVAWSWLGIGGRTAVLVGLTLASGLVGQWLARRELVVAAEALIVVSLGLVVLDLVGARRAGWVEVPTDERFLALVGTTLLVVSVAHSTWARRLYAPQLTAPLGLALAAVGLGATTEHPQLLAAATVLSYTALAVLGHRLRLAVLPWVAITAGVIAFTVQGLIAVGEASEYPTLHGLWVEGHGFGLIAFAATALVPWLVVRDNDDLRQLVCAVSASVLTFGAAIPASDEGITAITLTAAASSVVWAVLAGAAPPRWYAVPRVPLVGSLLVLVPTPLLLAGAGITNLFTVAEPFAADAAVRLHPAPHLAEPLLLPLGVAVVVVSAALTLPRPNRFGPALAVIVAGTTLLTAAQYPVPLLVFVAALGPLGVAVALPSAVLTLVALGEIVVVAASLVVRRTGQLDPPAALVLPVALGLFLWTGGHVVEAPDQVRSLAVLVALGLLALAVPRLELAIGAVPTVLGASMVGVMAAGDPSVSASVHLTLAGSIVTAGALLRPEHRALAWPGGLLLAAATWVRLYDIGVHAPEPYTLPTAVALVLVGLHRLRRDPAAETVPTLLPGLTLATVPSLLWVLADPVSTRAAVLGAACLAVLLAGTTLRWTAPVLVGWAVGGLLVLRELAPYAAQTPQWVLIGAAGTVLIGVGVTWEARLRDLRQAAAYLGRLR